MKGQQSVIDKKIRRYEVLKRHIQEMEISCKDIAWDLFKRKKNLVYLNYVFYKREGSDEFSPWLKGRIVDVDLIPHSLQLFRVTIERFKKDFSGPVMIKGKPIRETIDLNKKAQLLQANEHYTSNNHLYH